LEYLGVVGRIILKLALKIRGEGVDGVVESSAGQGDVGGFFEEGKLKVAT
jgi:hypothetical protein